MQGKLGIFAVLTVFAVCSSGQLEAEGMSTQPTEPNLLMKQKIAERLAELDAKHDLRRASCRDLGLGALDQTEADGVLKRGSVVMSVLTGRVQAVVNQVDVTVIELQKVSGEKEHFLVRRRGFGLADSSVCGPIRVND